VGQCTRAIGLGAEVQILSPRPIFIFDPLANTVEWLSVCRIKTYAIDCAVQKHDSEQLRSFRHCSGKVNRMSLLAQFKNFLSRQEANVAGLALCE
jgi:hypothetical protein